MRHNKAFKIKIKETPKAENQFVEDVFAFFVGTDEEEERNPITMIYGLKKK